MPPPPPELTRNLVQQLSDTYTVSDADLTTGRVSGDVDILLLIGYFEGLESERGICWRCEDSLSI